MEGRAIGSLVARQARRLGGTRWGVVVIGHVVSPVQRQLYRRSGGRLSLTGRAPVLLLTTLGRRTGLERTVPLLYLREGDRLVVCNVNPGFEKTNPWVLNLRAQPHARVQVRRDTYPVVAREATAEELNRYWPRLSGLWPACQRFYDQGGERTVFILEQAPAAAAPSPAAVAPSLWWLYAGSLHRPRKNARAIAGAEARRQAYTAVAGFALLYSVAAMTAFLTGRRPQHSPLMRLVPPERYYLWESLFEPPVTFAWMMLFSLLVRTGARRLGGTGTWRSDFAALAIGHTTPLIAAMWLPDMTCYLIKLDEQRYRRIVAVYAPAATAWALTLCIIGIHETEQLSWPKAAATVLIADGSSAVATGIPFVMR